MKDFYEITPTNMLTARGYSMTPQQQQQFQSNIGPISPQMAWQYPPTIKTEERNNDSGITSCSDFNSSPSGSETMDNFSPKNEENFPKINYHTTPIYKKQQEQQPTPKIKEEIMDTSDDDRDTTLKKLEMSLEKNLSSSPGLSETSNENYKEEDDYNTPRLNSHGKVKTHKCKHCPFVAITRADFWAHQREHINPDKLLKCQQCPFVSEYKHHLEYHMRNHDGSKPFKCKSCDYTCVNKSMLNSHLKSHSNVYQYRCNTCNYSSKYCHSLKLHLRKHKHEPAMVLNPDGTPNPLPIIDVYGTRRGPKIKHRNNASSPTISTTTTTPPIIPPPPTTTTLVQNEIRPEFNKNLLDQYLLLQQRMTEINQHQYQQQLQQLQQYQQQQQQNDEENVGPLDLRCKTDDEEDDDDTITTVFPNVEVVDDSSSTTTTTITQETKKSTKTCQFCDITFGGSDDDVVLHSLHMNQHGFVNPFTCNMCGEKCEDKIKFQLHIVRSAHIL